jgi:ribokinase
VSRSTRRIDVLVVGGANFDFSVKGAELPAAGQTVIGHSFHAAPGGKGANQAIAAARLGARTAFVGRIGLDSHGVRVVEQLVAERVEVHAIRDAEKPTGVALIMVDARGQKAILTAPGANLELSVDDIEHAARLFAESKVLLVQLESGVATTLAAVRQARNAHAMVVVDLAPPCAVPDELLALTDVARCNAHEAKVVTGIEVHDSETARKAGQELRRRGAGAACIAMPGGDLVVFETDELWLPYHHFDVVDTTGAGDAFAAGIAVGLAEDRSLSDAARLGSVASALKTTRFGAQAGLPTRTEVDGVLATIDTD